MDETKDLTGWKCHWWHWHFVQDGVSLCDKFTVRILGGGKPRRPWPQEMPQEEHTPVCEECKKRLDAIQAPPKS